jgi:hypothetical protein
LRQRVLVEHNPSLQLCRNTFTEGIKTVQAAYVWLVDASYFQQQRSPAINAPFRHPFHLSTAGGGAKASDSPVTP